MLLFFLLLFFFSVQFLNLLKNPFQLFMFHWFQNIIHAIVPERLLRILKIAVSAEDYKIRI